MKTEISEQIIAEFQKFVQDQMEKIDHLNLENININPILAKTLGYQTPEEVVEFFVNQRFQRGGCHYFWSKCFREEDYKVVCRISWHRRC